MVLWERGWPRPVVAETFRRVFVGAESVQVCILAQGSTRHLPGRMSAFKMEQILLKSLVLLFPEH